VRSFYEAKRFRVKRFTRTILKMRTEDRMVRAFVKDRGLKREDIKKTVLAVGDWSGFGKGHRHNVCSKGVGLMHIFRRWGFLCFFVHEFRTSKMCSNCQDPQAENKKWKKVCTTHSLSYSLTHTHSLTHSLTYSLSYSLTLTHSLTHSLTLTTYLTVPYHTGV
jgi:hypothetical protein